LDFSAFLTNTNIKLLAEPFDFFLLSAWLPLALWTPNHFSNVFPQFSSEVLSVDKSIFLIRLFEEVNQ
jgi:hypothetical protein